MLSQDVQGAGTTVVDASGSWDPYDVWLKRVKQPRDRQPGRASIIQPVLQAAAPADLVLRSGPARHDPKLHGAS